MPSTVYATMHTIALSWFEVLTVYCSVRIVFMLHAMLYMHSTHKLILAYSFALSE